MAWQTVYEDTDKLIERDDVPVSGTGTPEDPFVYQERVTYRARVLPQNVLYLSEDVDAQEAIDKIDDLRALATLVQGSPDVTTGNIVGQFQAFKNELPSLLRTVAKLVEREVRGS